jgi:predicted alpha/beta-fold hydrolase
MNNDHTLADDFAPNRIMRNPFAQSALSGIGLRRALIKRRNQAMLHANEDMLLECGDGVRLLGHYSPAGNPERGLATLIHGWEGSSESNYILSLAGRLYRSGYSVFRLNLRDHGPTHHLNPELFNSMRLDEVLGAIDDIHRRLTPRRHFLAGFSLGGNFSLRVAADRAGHAFKLDHVIAVCPVIHPPATMLNVEEGKRIYQAYFVRKWKRSLSRKVEHFPDYDLKQMIADMTSLREMHHYFVPNFTDFEDTESYLNAYSLTGDRLKNLATPATIIASEDDPIIPVHDLKLIDKPPALSIEITRYGGHCGYIENLHLDSWIDKRIELILAQYDSATKSLRPDQGAPTTPQPN